MRAAIKALVERQNAAIDALATPIIPLSKDIIVVPLVGDMDARRVEQFRESLVHALHERQVPVALVDLTGVPHLEADVAAGIFKAAKTAHLLGAHVILTGLQPEVAAQVADLPLASEGMQTERNLQAGMRRAQALVHERPGQDQESEIDPPASSLAH
jgi:rsbT co-antagonist protein RsbR